MVETLELPASPVDISLQFDIIAAYGVADGWQTSPIVPRVGFIISPDALTPEFARLVIAGVDPQAIALNIPFAQNVPTPSELISPRVIRERFANLGLPDGIGGVIGAAAVPGVEELRTLLDSFNVQSRAITLSNDGIRQAFAEGRISMAIITWTNEDEATAWRDLFGGEYVRELYALPIRYLATPDLNITFTAGGWPIPAPGG